MPSSYIVGGGAAASLNSNSIKIFKEGEPSMVAYVIEICRHESSITYYHFKTHGSSHTIATIYHLYIHPINPP
jgi:hypothetical protein